MDTIDKKVYAVWSPKGGVGKTLITAHLAKLSTVKGLLTGVIDLNRQTASIPAALDIRLPSEKSLREALFTEHDSDVITNFHNNEKNNRLLFCVGLNINNKVDDLFEVTDTQILRLLEISKTKFNILFLDLPTSYFELTSYESLKFADKIIVIIDNDYNSVVALKAYLKFLEEINIPLQNILLVINKDMGLLSEKEILEMCNLSVCAIVPFNKHLVKDMNEGKTVFDNGGSYNDRKTINSIEKIFKVLIDDGKCKVYERKQGLFNLSTIYKKIKGQGETINE